MSKGLMFWILMLLWFVSMLGLFFWKEDLIYLRWSGTALQFLLFFLLGWHAFGAPVK